MLENCRNAKERWGGVSEIIDRWLRERQELIVRYCDLTAKADVPADVRAVQYQSFCQILVDYVSAGHFEVYGQLIEEAREFGDGGEELANKVMPDIDKTTEVALNFNDRFDDINRVDDGLGTLDSEIPALGQVLEERFSLEDMLIEQLHTVHADQVA
ncbi:MAG: sigma D regulator [Hahellaceae bacterium]|nr:sigma D regulator [Hahellaceae bacterium]MCP5168167.1 sigma D regulator [Hahellaceae bacterium]